MVPLGIAGIGQAVVLVVNVVLEYIGAVRVGDAVGAVAVAVVEEPGGGVPVFQCQVDEVLAAPHVVEEAPVIAALVVVVQIVVPVPLSAALGVLFTHHRGAPFHQGD